MVDLDPFCQFVSIHKMDSNSASLWADVVAPGQLNQRGGAGELKEQIHQGSRLGDTIAEYSLQHCNVREHLTSTAM